MAKVGGEKKGVLFTVSVMLLGISLLTFSSFIAGQSVKTRYAASALLDIDRASEAYSAIEDQLARIISPSINFSVSNSTASISASLPWSSQVASDIAVFEEFEERYSDLNVSLDAANPKNGYFLIQPGNVSITQSEGIFGITPLDSPDSWGRVKSYDVNLTLPSASFDSASWQALSAGGNETMDVHVRVMDQSYALILDFIQTLDKNGTSLLNITQAGAEVGTVQFSPLAALEVRHTGNMGLKASVGFSNRVYVEANDAISISSASNRTSRIRVA